MIYDLQFYNMRLAYCSKWLYEVVWVVLTYTYHEMVYRVTNTLNKYKNQ